MSRNTDTLQELLNVLAQGPLANIYSDANIADYIDQFDFNDISNQLQNYWNESVYKLLEEADKIIDNPWNLEENKKISSIHDAAKDFSNRYVSPNPNFKQEEYVDNRTDELEEVLKDSKKLDYTIKDYESLTEEFKKYVTRLIMPQYERRVEVEDLNRNFWVIGQNLSLLNKMVFDLGNGLIQKLIGELTGLWDNIYRLWQAIFFLAGKIDEAEENINKLAAAAAKTKIKLAFGWSFSGAGNSFTSNDVIDRLYKEEKIVTHDEKEVPTLVLSDNFLFKKSDAKHFGFLPYLEKERIVYNGQGDTGSLFYLPYNKTLTKQRLDALTDEEADDIFILGQSPGPGGHGEIIGIERKFGNKPAKELLQSVRAKNFVLISPNPDGQIPLLDSLVSVYDPILIGLQFYRDVIYSVSNLDNNQPFGTLIEDTFTWMQGGYIEYLNFSESREWKDNDKISDKIISAHKFINDFISKSDIRFVSLTQALDSYSTIAAFKNRLLGSGANLENLITDFYRLYLKCANFIEFNTTNAPYFIDKADGRYEVLTNNPETFSIAFKEAVQLYNKENSSDGIGNYNYLPTPYLFNGNAKFFDYNTGDYLSINYTADGPKFYKLDVGGSSTVIRDIRMRMVNEEKKTLHWDLLSNMFFPDGFSEGKTVGPAPTNGGAYKKVVKWDYNDNLITGNDAIAAAKQKFNKATQRVDPLAGWWIEDKHNSLGNSYIYKRDNSFGIWFEFVLNPPQLMLPFLNIQLNSFTMNETAQFYFNGLASNSSDCYIGGPNWSSHHYYNVDITIPFDNVGAKPYWDFIRLGKPYPSIARIITSRVEDSGDSVSKHLTALNTNNNYISYDTRVLDFEDNGESYFIDGFYGFETLQSYPLGNIPRIKNIQYEMTNVIEDAGGNILDGPNRFLRDIWRKRKDGDNNEIYYYGAPYKANVTYQIASTDLINAHISTIGDIKEGSTKKENTNTVDDPLINISYLSGTKRPQELSIFVSKDETQQVWKRDPII